MKAPSLYLGLFVVGFGAAVAVASDQDTKVTALDVLNARIREEAAKKAAAQGTTVPPATPVTDKAAPAATPAGTVATAPNAAGQKLATPPTTAPSGAKPVDATVGNPIFAHPPIDKATKPADAAANTKREPATLLPAVDVTRTRITEIDRQLHEQELDMAREKEYTKPTELDKALNNDKISKTLAIFGGQSGDGRAAISSERVSIMQEEHDLIEQMKYAKTKEEKADLQKQIDELRSYRRELEKSLH